MKRYEARDFDTVEKMAAHWLGDKVGTPRTKRYVGNILRRFAFAAPPAKSTVSTTALRKQAGRPGQAQRPTRDLRRQAGDTMSGIAKRELGSSARWPWRSTEDPGQSQLIGADPGLIRPGQRLTMPPR